MEGDINTREFKFPGKAMEDTTSISSTVWWFIGILTTLVLIGTSGWMTYIVALSNSQTLIIENLRSQVAQVSQSVNLHEFKLTTIDSRLQHIEEKLDRALDRQDGKK